MPIDQEVAFASDRSTVENASVSGIEALATGFDIVLVLTIALETSAAENEGVRTDRFSSHTIYDPPSARDDCRIVATGLTCQRNGRVLRSM
jgi:hypothetical protein